MNHVNYLTHLLLKNVSKITCWFQMVYQIYKCKVRLSMGFSKMWLVIMFLPVLNYSLEQLKLMEATVGLTVSSAKELCASTMEQSKDTLWYAERSRRVTSSVFGKIINRRKSAHPTSLIKSILNRQKKASVSASVQWGLDNETNAIVKYQNELQNSITVANCGLVVSPKWPWLGCSPDGIVMNQGIPVGCVEVKCPLFWPIRPVHYTNIKYCSYVLFISRHFTALTFLIGCCIYYGGSTSLFLFAYRSRSKEYTLFTISKLQ